MRVYSPRGEESTWSGQRCERRLWLRIKQIFTKHYQQKRSTQIHISLEHPSDIKTNDDLEVATKTERSSRKEQHIMQCADPVAWRWKPETYVILLTDVFPINFIKKKKGRKKLKLNCGALLPVRNSHQRTLTYPHRRLVENQCQTRNLGREIDLSSVRVKKRHYHII